LTLLVLEGLARVECTVVSYLTGIEARRVELGDAVLSLLYIDTVSMEENYLFVFGAAYVGPT